MKTQLTKEQKIILRHNDGMGFITAGAGTGKTTTLLEYVMHHIWNEGADPEDFLVLSFSKAAGKEFKDRLLLNKFKHGGAFLWLDQVDVMTYDAFGYEIIREHYAEFGFRNEPVVVTNTKRLRKCAAKIAQKQGAEIKALTKDVTRTYHGLTMDNDNPLVDKVLKVFAKVKQRRNLLDFKDMMSLLQGDKVAYITRAAKHYRYLLVDELQDTDCLQAKMLVTLASAIPTVLMVGDPKQNIYEFRGALARNWQDITSKLTPKEYTLTKTQRIPQQSLPFINAIGKEIYPGAPLSSDIEGQPIQYISCQDFGESQANFIATEIRRLIDSKLASHNDIACLGRTRRLLSDLAILLKHGGIPVHESYKPETGNHLIGLRNMLRIVRRLRRIQPGNELQLTPKLKLSLGRWLKDLGASPTEIQRVFDNLPRKGWKAMSVPSRLNKKQPKHYNPILTFRNRIAQAANADEPEKAIMYLMDALRQVLRKKYSGMPLHLLIRDLSEIKVASRQFNNVDTINLKKLKLKKPSAGVHLGTMNGAKGKEWKYVFVINCTQGVIPIHYAKSEASLLAEKRLLYVASTRHKEGLYLIHSLTSHVVYSDTKYDRKLTEESIFISKHAKLLNG